MLTTHQIILLEAIAVQTMKVWSKASIPFTGILSHGMSTSRKNKKPFNFFLVEGSCICYCLLVCACAFSACIYAMHTVLYAFKSRNCIQMKIKCKLSKLLLDQFLFLPMVYFFCCESDIMYKKTDHVFKETVLAFKLYCIFSI